MKVKPIILQSVSILDSEELIDVAYNNLLSCLSWFPVGASKSIEAKVFTGARNPQKEMAPFFWALDGIYMPASKRDYWYGSFDLTVDEVPERCCVYTNLYKDSSLEYTVVERIKRKPAHIACGLRDKHAAHWFKTTYVIMPDMTKERVIKDPIVHVSYFGMDKEGGIWTAIDTRKFNKWVPAEMCRSDEYHGAHLGPGALSLTADQKYLWLIKTTEKTGIGDTEAKVVFGIEEPMVKSLFFARESPLTDTGRKRPILHWVREHKRRIMEGIEIDIDKYMRGITKMTMGSMEFEITQPQKRMQLGEREKRQGGVWRQEGCLKKTSRNHDGWLN